MWFANAHRLENTFYKIIQMFRKIKHDWDMNVFENAKMIADVIDSLN